jgi:hypothetical protein
MRVERVPPRSSDLQRVGLAPLRDWAHAMAKPLSLLVIASLMGVLAWGAAVQAQGTGSGGCFFGECDEAEPRSPNPGGPHDRA